MEEDPEYGEWVKFEDYERLLKMTACPDCVETCRKYHQGAADSASDEA